MCCNNPSLFIPLQCSTQHQRSFSLFPRSACDEYISPSLAVSYVSPARAVYTVPAPAVVYINPAPAASLLLQHLQCMLHWRPWTSLSSSWRELCRACSVVECISPAPVVSYASPSPAVYAASAPLVKVHLPSTSRESCRASSRRGPHFSSSCSVCLTSSSGGARQSCASGELRHASFCSVCCVSSNLEHTSLPPATSNASPAPTGHAVPALGRVEHSSPAGQPRGAQNVAVETKSEPHNPWFVPGSALQAGRASC